jgi:hypothetical protein
MSSRENAKPGSAVGIGPIAATDQRPCAAFPVRALARYALRVVPAAQALDCVAGRGNGQRMNPLLGLGLLFGSTYNHNRTPTSSASTAALRCSIGTCSPRFDAEPRTRHLLQRLFHLGVSLGPCPAQWVQAIVAKDISQRWGESAQRLPLPGPYRSRPIPPWAIAKLRPIHGGHSHNDWR